MPHDANKEEMGGGEKDGGAAAEQGAGEAEPDGGSGGGSRGNGSDGASAESESVLPLQSQTYKEAAESYYLQHSDNNMVGGRLDNQHSPEGTLSSDVSETRHAPQ